jgi:ubiquilin
MLNHPMIASMARQNPEMAFLLNNPDMLRAMFTPESIRMAMSMMQQMRGMPGAGAMPGMNPFFGVNMPRPSAGTGAEATTSSAASFTTGVPGASSFSGSAPGTQPQPNPFANLMQMMGGYGGGYPGAGYPPASTAPSAPSAPQAPAVDPKVLYASQLAQMKEMGFTNEEVNIQELKASNGNVAIAIERLLQKLGS